MNGIASTAPRGEYFGRHVLTASPSHVLDAGSVAAILDNVLPLHEKNAREIDYLYRYACGHQPILSRKKEIRSDICNLVVENRALEVINFKLGYEFANPIIYTNAGMSDSLPIDKLNTFARIDGKEAKDLSLAEWFYRSGTAYKICLPKNGATEDDAPYFTSILDPREAFVVYSSGIGREPLFAGTVVEQTNIETGHKTRRCGVYTATKYYEWMLDAGIANLKQAPFVESNNGLGRIPIVEYYFNENRMGYIDMCYWLFNAINTIGSNRIDAIEQFVQAIMVFLGCELPVDDEGEKYVPRTGDAIELPGRAGSVPDVKYIVAQLDQAQTQITKDDLLRSVYEICGVPDRQNRNQGGGDTGQAVVLRNGWGSAESRAKSTEKLFKRSEYEYLKLVLRICRDTQGVDIGDMTLHDIGIAFTRNRSDNMQVKAQTLKMLLDAGVNPEDAYDVSELFGDSVAVWNKSKQWQDIDSQWVESKLKLARKITGEQEPAIPDRNNGVEG